MRFNKVYIIFLFLIIISLTKANAQCQAGFAYTDSLGLVTFIDTSTSQSGAITSWFWDFGDSTSSTLQYATHQFNTIGTYYVCLTINVDSNCTSTYCDSVYIGNIVDPCAGFTITYIVDNETYSGAYDGSIDVTPVGGTPPYTYTWSIGPSVEDPTGLTAGTYCVSVSSSDPCPFATCINVGVDSIVAPCANFVLNNIVVTNETQTGANDGVIDISVIGGVMPYTYLWNNGASTEDISGLDSGLYCVTISDDSICSIDTCLTIGLDSIANTYVLSGQVYTSTGVLASGTAKLYSSSDSTNSLYTTTINNGFYLFNNILAGNYKLLVVPSLPESNDYASTYFGNEYNFNDSYLLNINANTYSVDITLQATLSVNELKNINSIEIYPNPANEVIYINNKNLDVLFYSIINNLGQNVLNGLYSENSIDIHNLPEGVYILHLRYSDKLYTSKFIKTSN